MKKIISFLLILTLCINVVSFSAFAQEEYKLTDEQMTLLTAIGMYDKNVQLSQEVTRGEFADMLVRSIFDEPEYLIAEEKAFNDVGVDSEYYAPVMLLKNLKVTLGDGNGNFKPNEKILANDAIVMAVRFLGYTKLAEKTGYIPFAAQKGISKGVQYSYEDNLSLYNALILIFNVLSVDVSEQYPVDSAATFLKVYRTLNKIEGVVEDDGIINKYGLSEISKDEIVIDGKIYKNATSHKNLFGYNVVAYYRYSRDEDATVVALTVTDKNNTLTIDSRNIEKYAPETHSYHYRENEFSDDIEEIDIPLNISIIYNGVPVTVNDKQFTNDSFVPKTGSVTFFDSDDDNKYDYLYINSYDTYVVSTTDVTKQVIYMKDFDKPLELEEGKYEILDKNNEVIPLSEIKEGCVLSVLKPFTGDEIRIYVSNKVVVDVVSAKDDDGIITTQNNGEFELSNHFIEKEYERSDKTNSKISEALENIEFSLLYRIYIDVFGYVAFIEAENTNLWSAGFLINAANNARSALSEDFVVEVYTLNGQTEKHNLAKKVNISDQNNVEDRYEDERAIEILNTFAGNNTNANRLIRYKLSLQGIITDVELPLTEGYPIEELNGDRLYITRNASSSTIPYNAGGSFVGRLVPSKECKTFVVNKKNVKDTESAALCAVADLFKHDKQYNVIGYGTDTKNMVSDYIVYPVDDILNYSFTDTNGYMIVSKILEEFDREKMVTRYKIEGVMGTTPTTVYVENSSVIKNIPVFETGKTIDLEQGDIIAYSINSRVVDRVTLNGIIVLYDADGVLPETGKGFFGNNNGIIAGAKADSVLSADVKEYGNPVALKTLGTSYTVDANSHTNPMVSPCRIATGFVYSVKDGNVVLTTQPLNSTKYTTLANTSGEYVTEIYNNVSRKIVKVKKTSGGKVQIAAGTETDLKPYTVYGHACSQVVFLGYWGLNYLYVFE